jgi:hypothetical protein
LGDLWKPLLGPDRFDLGPLVTALKMVRARLPKRHSSVA